MHILSRSLTVGLAVVALLCASLLHASTAIPIGPKESWICGFEETDTLDDWHLNESTPDASDKWMIGNATSSLGKRSLYISNDDGISPFFGSSPNIVVAYRKIKFPTDTTLRHYNISFDWKCIGDTNLSHLYVYFGLEQEFEDPSSSTTGYLSAGKKSKMQVVKPENTRQLYDCSSWTTSSFDVNVSRTYSKDNYILAFVWENANTKLENCAIGACIDNIEIAYNQILKPDSLQVTTECEDSALVVEWNAGSGTEFTIKYKKSSSPYWKVLTGLHVGSEITTINTPQGQRYQYSITDLSEGSYDVRITQANTNWESPAAYQRNVVLYCPENHCINYVNLSDPSVVCSWGHFLKNNSYEFGPDTVWGVVDKGINEAESRHTVCWDTEAYDERTGGKLRIVPEGELASVRLNSWCDAPSSTTHGHFYSQVDYHITVEDKPQLLIFKYALVQEYSSSHSSAEQTQARFRLDILDENGNIIDAQCGQTGLSAGEDKQGNPDWTFWNWEGKEEGSQETPTSGVVWSNWTSVGLDLESVRGQDIIVRIIASGCTQSAHYGYAYYTLDCVSAELKTENCGSESNIEVEAPDGFDYVWFRGDPAKRDTVSTEARMEAPSGNWDTYTCKMIFQSDTGCYMMISTFLAPRYPIPDYKMLHAPKNCENWVTFENTSYVGKTIDNVLYPTSEPCDRFEWWFYDSSGNLLNQTAAQNPKIIVPSEGDTITVIQKASIGTEESPCDSTITTRVYIPTIFSDMTIRDTAFCEGGYVEFAGEIRSTTGTYYDTIPNMADCDSVTQLNLTVYPKSPDTYDSIIICSTKATPYTHNGYRYFYDFENHIIDATEWDIKNIHGCDSTVHLHLEIKDTLKLTVDPLPEFLCPTEAKLTINTEILFGEYDSLRITFSPKADPTYFKSGVYNDMVETFNYPYPREVVPDSYYVDLDYYQPQVCGCPLHYRLPFAMQYDSAIMQQKWNDVIAIRKNVNNYTYDFTTYQWYKDGDAIPGATNIYLDMSKGYTINGQYQTTLTPGSEYYLEVTRASDGVTMTSCPIHAISKKDSTKYHVLISPQPSSGIPARLTLDAEATCRLYTVDGRLYTTFQGICGEQTFQTPSVAGVYILIVEFNNSELIETKKIIVQ